tara:strand:+ start:2727 stop:3551 length:825 start_codon:yes stop_codon:yes gene_type:complete
MAITHNKVVSVADDGTSPVGSDEWNDDHTIGINTITDTMVSTHTTTKITVPHTNITGLATSATTDTTNADNIGSGTLPLGRLTGTITTAELHATAGITSNQLAGSIASSKLSTVAIAQGGSGAATQQAAIDALTAVAGASNEYVLTKDTSSSNAVWKAASTVAAFDDLTDVTGGSATGTMLYKSAGDWIALTSSGHGGKTLQMNTGATAPEWATASGGGMDPEIAGTVKAETYTPTAATQNATAYMFVRKIDSNNDGLFITLWKNGSSQVVQIA